MEDGVHRAIDVKRLADIVLERFEVAVGAKVGDIAGCASDEVVDTEDLPAIGEEPLAEVGPQEARPASDERAAWGYERPTPRYTKPCSRIRMGS
jgi:hypothetical protein